MTPYPLWGHHDCSCPLQKADERIVARGEIHKSWDTPRIIVGRKYIQTKKRMDHIEKTLEQTNDLVSDSEYATGGRSRAYRSRSMVEGGR